MNWYSDFPAPGSVSDPTAPANTSAIVVSRTTGADVSGHRVLMLSGTTVIHADPTTAGYVFAGLSTQAAVSGSLVGVCEAGEVVEPSWSWAPGAALYAGPGGVLTATPPASGILQQVAVASSPTTIIVCAFPPITRM